MLQAHQTGESPCAPAELGGDPAPLGSGSGGGGPSERWDPRRGSYLGSFSASSSGQALFPGGAGGAWVPPLTHRSRLAQFTLRGESRGSGWGSPPSRFNTHTPPSCPRPRRSPGVPPPPWGRGGRFCHETPAEKRGEGLTLGTAGSVAPPLPPGKGGRGPTGSPRCPGCPGKPSFPAGPWAGAEVTGVGEHRLLELGSPLRCLHPITYGGTFRAREAVGSLRTLGTLQEGGEKNPTVSSRGAFPTAPQRPDPLPVPSTLFSPFSGCRGTPLHPASTTPHSPSLPPRRGPRHGQDLPGETETG